MNYNNIMELDEKREGSVVFEESQSQSPQTLQSIIKQKQQKSLNSMSQTFNQRLSEALTSDVVTCENLVSEIKAEMVKVKSIQSSQIIEQEEKHQNNLIYSSQTSYSSQIQVEKEKKEDEPGNHSNLVFDYEDSDDSELSPQSSLRKLYKTTQIKGPPNIYQHSLQEEKLIKVDIVHRQNKMKEQIQQYQDQDINSDLEEEQIEQLKHKNQLKSDKLKDLIIFPIPKTKMIRCLVIITNNSFFSLQSTFDLYLVQEKRHLLRAKKKRFRIFSTFQIFGKEEEQTNIIASVRSNFTRTQYKLIQYTKEIELTEHHNVKSSPQVFSSDIIKVQTVVSDIPLKIVEEQCSYIGYQSNFLGFSQQKLTMLKPRKKVLKTERFSDLKTAFENCEYERVQNFSTRLAEKGSDGKLILDFKDKSITNSSRNMIIENENSEVGLMFAKFSDDIYILNVMNPFNLLEGFFLGLCNLDRKPFVS